MTNIVQINSGLFEGFASGSKAEWAMRYAQRGVKVFPVWGITDGQCDCQHDKLPWNRKSHINGANSPGKHPIGDAVARGFEDASSDLDTVAAWWRQYPNANIGIPMEMNGLVAIDIDPRNGGLFTLEKLEGEHGKIESDVTHYTGGGGMHFVFVLPKSITSLPGKLGAGIDVKLNGYILGEGSKTEGEYWAEEGFGLVDSIPSPMPDWIRSLSVQQTGIAVDPGEPNCDPGLLEEIKQALDLLSSDCEYPDWIAVGMSLHHDVGGAHGFQMWDEWSQRAAHRYNSTMMMRHWNSFSRAKASTVTRRTLFQMVKEKAGSVIHPSPLRDAQLVDIDELTSRALVRVAAENEKPSTCVEPFPPELMKVPGVLGQFVEHVMASSWKPQISFAVSSSLVLGSVLMARNWASEANDRTGLYVMNIGPSASGKDAGRVAIMNVLHAAGLSSQLLGGEDIKSDSALFARMVKQPACLFLLDEFGMKLQRTYSRNASNHEKAMIELMMRFWTSTKNPAMGGPERVTVERQDISFPSCNLLMTTTGEMLWEGLTGKEILSGALNRILLIETDTPDVKKRRPVKRESDVPQALVEWAKQTQTEPMRDFAKHNLNGLLADNPRIIKTTDAALAILDKFSDECEAAAKEHRSTGIDALFHRAAEQASRISIVIAGSVSIESPVIGEREANWAVAFVRHCLRYTVSAVSSNVADSEFHRQQQEVMRVMRRKQVASVRELCKASRTLFSMKDQEIENALSSLVRNGELEKGTQRGQRGPAKVIYFLPDLRPNYVQDGDENDEKDAK